MEIEIIEYSSIFYKPLLSILKEVYDSDIERNVLEEMYLGSGKNIYLAKADDNIIGCAFLEMKRDYVRPYKYGFISYVAVDKSYRQHGIGRKLIEKIIDVARANDCSAIELTSANSRETAHIFYQTLGFTKKKTTVFIKELM